MRAFLMDGALADGDARAITRRFSRSDLVAFLTPLA
jgi:hypothetical protein